MIARSLQMKITRERLEAILREEIAAVAEDVRDYPSKGETMKTPPGTIGASRPEDEDEVDPGTEKARGPLQKEGDVSDSPWPGKGNPFIKPSGKAQPKQSDPWRDTHKRAGTGTYNPPKTPVKNPRGWPTDLDIAKGEKPSRPPKRAPIAESSTSDADLKAMLSLLEGHMEQDVPPVQDDQRARELLDGFKNMLKPQERAEPSACATFLRQLADLAEREGGAPDAGTMPEPVPNN
jgi:hypothetical protein